MTVGALDGALVVLGVNGAIQGAGNVEKRVLVGAVIGGMLKGARDFLAKSEAEADPDRETYS